MSALQNELSFAGDETEIHEMLKRIASPVDCRVYFNNIYPIPEELAALSAGLARVKIDCYLTMVNPMTKDYGVDKLSIEEFTRLFNIPSKYYADSSGSAYYHDITGKYVNPDPAFFEPGKQMINNIELFGAANWFDWCLKNWGQINNPQINPNKYFNESKLLFDTDSLRPKLIIEKLAEQYPSIKIQYRWADKTARDAGTASYENGVCVSEQHYTAYSPEARALSNDLFTTPLHNDDTLDEEEQPEH